MSEVLTLTNEQEVNLMRRYSREAMIEPQERFTPHFVNDMKKWEDEKNDGIGLFFMVTGADGHGVGNPAEVGDFSRANTPNRVLCEITKAQLDSVVEVSSQYLAASKNSFTGDADEDLILQATRNALSYFDVLTGAGAGDGVLATVDQAVVNTNSFIARRSTSVPDGGFKLRNNQPIDFVDGSGVVQATTIIAAPYDYKTSTVQVADNVTLTAGWKVYQRDVVGNPMPNGIYNIVDDGGNAATIFGKSRNDFPYLSAQVYDAGLQDWSEELMDEFLDAVTVNQEYTPTVIRSNKGVVTAYKSTLVRDRLFLQNNEPPDYKSGSNYENIVYVYGSQKIPWKVDRNMPVRDLVALYMPAWRSATLRPLDWVQPMPGKSPWMLKPSGDTYSYVLVASLMQDRNIFCKRLNANGRLKNIKDRSLARDS